MEPHITCNVIKRFTFTVFTKDVHSILFSPCNTEGFYAKILLHFSSIQCYTFRPFNSIF